MVKTDTKTIQKILIVEDNLSDSNLLIRYLKKPPSPHIKYLLCETANRALILNITSQKKSLSREFFRYP